MLVRSADDLNDEVEIVGPAHEFEPIIAAIGEEVLHPEPTLADVLPPFSGGDGIRSDRREGGPGIPAILDLLKGCGEPQGDQVAFLKRQIIWRTGTTNGHGKIPASR